MEIAFIGLGIMGLPMATNLVRAGHQVVGFNRSPERVALLVESGGAAARSIEEAVAGADVVVTVLPDSPDVEQVVAGPGGVLASARAGSLIVDMSTISPRAARGHHGGRAGFRVLDAPVSGGERGAVEGFSRSWSAGPPTTWPRDAGARCLGTTIVHVGGPAPDRRSRPPTNSSSPAPSTRRRGDRLLERSRRRARPAARARRGPRRKRGAEPQGVEDAGRSLQPGFRVDLHHKDLGIYMSAARASA